MIDYIKLSNESAPMAAGIIRSLIENGHGYTYGHISMSMAMAIRSVTDTLEAEKGVESGRDASLRVCDGIRALLEAYPEGLSAQLPK